MVIGQAIAILERCVRLEDDRYPEVHWVIYDGMVENIAMEYAEGWFGKNPYVVFYNPVTQAQEARFTGSQAKALRHYGKEQ